MVEPAGINVLEYLGQPIEPLVARLKEGSKTDFDIQPTKEGTGPKGIFYTCRDKGF